MDGADRDLGAPVSAEPMEPVAVQKVPGIPVSVQARARQQHEHTQREPAPAEEHGSMDTLCDTEFKEDFVRLFEALLRTLPSVGLPTLLAYRPQPSQESTQAMTEEDSTPRCEYCSSPLRPFPPFEDACLASESEFCCARNRDLYEFIISERKKREGAQSIPAAACPHESPGTEAKLLLAKERAWKRQQERDMARQLAFLAAEKSTAERSDSAGAISYLLSREPPSPQGRMLAPSVSAAQLEQEPCGPFTPAAGKVVKKELLEKYYKQGGKFLTMLPNGTAQIFYPSGNLAVLMVREEQQLVCVVQEDEPSSAAIRAVFKSNGRSTCYYPNGAVWINMTILGGQYLDRAGSRVRRWTWANSSMSPGPRVPLSPIFISLNRHVGVRILGQDKITVSFLAMGQQAKFNVGTRVEASDVGRLPRPARLGETELLLLAFRVRILLLFDRLRRCLDFPSSEQQDRIQPPAHLLTQTWKILQLCTASDISEELCSSIRAIVNVHI